MGRIIGIDLGTTNSLATVWRDGRAELIPNVLGSYLTPSVVSIEKTGKHAPETVYVGETARQRLVTNPADTAAVFKRFMGCDKVYQLAGKNYRPEELSAFVLRALKEDAEQYLGESIDEAVISVPAYFNDMARNATRNAGRLAGLKVERIINEPSAAALAYRQMNGLKEGRVLVFDFGGGTLDVSLVDMFDNIVEILAVSGDNHLGGSDFDELIAMHFCRQNHLSWDVLDQEVKGSIRLAAEGLKKHLTEQETAAMNVHVSGDMYSMELSNQELILLAKPIFKRMLKPIERVLIDAGQGQGDLDGVVLAGGSCKMPVVRKYLEHLLGEGVLEASHIEEQDPDDMIALGAGVYAGIMEREEAVRDMLLTDICPFSLGVSVHNEDENLGKDRMSVLIERNTALPASRESIYTTIRNNQKQLELKIYQGENLYAEDNLQLGKLTVCIPPAPAGEQRVSVRFTYDINGILIVDAKVLATGMQKQAIIRDSTAGLTDEQLKEQVARLEQLKLHPREKEENKLLMARAERLFKETVSEMRQELERRIDYFQYLLGQQDEFALKRYAPDFDNFLTAWEQMIGYSSVSDETVDEFAGWYAGQAEPEITNEEKVAEQLYQMFAVWHRGRNPQEPPDYE